jgi:hypothetical protein
VFFAHVFDDGIGREPVLGEADAAGAVVGTELFVGGGVEPVFV